MKLFQVLILVLTFLFFSNTYSQEIEKKLVGQSATNGFKVKEDADKVLLKVSGEDLSSGGTATDFNSNLKDDFNQRIGSYEYPESKAFYVDNTASGTYDGSSWANAWNPTNGWDSTALNPNAINWNIIQPGDTIYISGGSSSKNYTPSSYFLPKANGTYDNYIYIVKGQDAGHNGTVILDRIGAMNGSSSPGHRSDSSLIHNHCIEFNGFQVNKYIAHQDEVATDNFVANGYHLRFKNITCDNVYEDKFFDFTGHPRYIEFIDCYLRQASNPGEQADLIWVRGDADYAGGGLYADSIFIIGCTLISNNQSSSPHSDGFQYVSVANVWTEGCKFYTANNKTTYSQTWYGNGYTGKAWFLNNVFYISTPSFAPSGPYVQPNYIVDGIVDSLYWVDNTMVHYSTVNKSPWIAQPVGTGWKYVIKNNITVGYGNLTTGIGIYNNPVSLVADYNQWYNPGQSNVVTYNGAARTFAYWQGLDAHALNSQPTFTDFDWNYSKTLSTYEAYDFNVPSPLNGTSFTTSFGGHTYISDGKIGALIPSITDPTDISDTLNVTTIKDFILYPNYPNPFNPKTVIKYQLPQESKVVIKIYDILGSEVMELLNEKKEAGIYEVEFKADNLASGIYIYRIIVDNFIQSKKMILLK